MLSRYAIRCSHMLIARARERSLTDEAVYLWAIHCLRTGPDMHSFEQTTIGDAPDTKERSHVQHLTVFSTLL